LEFTYALRCSIEDRAIAGIVCGRSKNASVFIAAASG
jgi:hypothetical protein